MILAVRDWDTLYENSETRKRKQLGWVLTPNRHDSLGYCKLMALGDQGLMIFGVWNVLLQLSSRGEEKARGYFVDDSLMPYSLADISIKTRVQIPHLKEAIPVLIDIGWLCEVSEDDLVCGIRKPSVSDADDIRSKIERKKDKKDKEESRGGRVASLPALLKDIDEVLNEGD